MALNILVVEDDFISRKVMTGLLRPFGHCDIAINGEEAIHAFEEALKANQRYDLICLDILMPKINGQEALKRIREIEAENDIHGLDRVKIIMTTALPDRMNIMGAFRGECEAYIVKPISKTNLIEQLHALELINKNAYYG